MVDVKIYFNHARVDVKKNVYKIFEFVDGNHTASGTANVMARVFLESVFGGEDFTINTRISYAMFLLEKIGWRLEQLVEVEGRESLCWLRNKLKESI